MIIQINKLNLTRGIEHCECPENFRIQGTKEVQIASLLRAKEVKIFDRGNSQITITFKVSRQHESVHSALTHVIEHIAIASGLHGNTFFHLEDGAHTAFVLQNSTIRHLSCHIEGVTSQHSYEIIGSNIKYILE